MGLCKCPRKRMTNLFCFEHHVNVCEDCLVHQHSKCVIKSYLNWLEDSDYDPNCPLCSRPFVEGECVRLVCYHLYHWSCLNRHVQELPENTAPAGYKCPQCQQGIFPKSNLATPVADALRKLLETTTWGQNGLGVGAESYGAEKTGVVTPSSSDESKSAPRETKISFQNLADLKDSLPQDGKNYEPVRRTAEFFDRSVASSSVRNAERELLLDSDYTENKYKRKPFMEWFQRLVRTYAPRPSANDARAGMRRLFVTVLVVLVLLLTFGVFLTSFNRAPEYSESDIEPRMRVLPAGHDSA